MRARLLAVLRPHFEATGARWMLAGGFAVAAWGSARTTLDLDLVVDEGPRDALVLALPRGGVPVGLEVAEALEAPLDVFLVRKLGVPGNEELAMGAVASGGVRVLNEEVVEFLGLSWPVIEEVTAHERHELERRYRHGLDPIDPRGKIVLLVDDGLATCADDVVCVLTPEPFDAVGRFYENFPQTTDEEVCAILERARTPCLTPSLSS